MSVGTGPAPESGEPAAQTYRQEGSGSMFRRFTAFCRQLFSNRGFRRGLRIFFWVFIAYYIYNVILYIAAAMKVGIPFRDALSFFFQAPLFEHGYIRPSASIAVGIAVGLIWYFHHRKAGREKEEPEEKAEEPAAPVQEEEIIETTRYNRSC